MLAFIFHIKAKNVHLRLQAPFIERLPNRAKPLPLVLIYDHTVTMVTDTTANLYVTVQLNEDASVCYSLTPTHCLHHSSLWPSSNLYSDWLEGY